MDAASTVSQTPPALAPDAPLFIVCNPRSGGYAPDELERVVAITLEAAGRPHRLFSIDEPSRLAAVARAAVMQAREAAGIVVGAGGDGTLGAVAHEVLGQGVAFGVVPRGTFNYFARAHGIAGDPASALRALLRARPEPVEVGEVNGRTFLVSASLGLYPQLLEDREAYKRQYGRYRGVALWAGLLTLLREHRQLRLKIQGDRGEREVLTPTLFVSNNPLQLRQVGVGEADAVALDVGLLAAIMVKPITPRTMLALALRGALGRLGEDANVETFLFRRLVVNPLGHRRIKVATDGEIWVTHAPCTFAIAREPLWLMVPSPDDRMAAA